MPTRRTNGTDGARGHAMRFIASAAIRLRCLAVVVALAAISTGCTGGGYGGSGNAPPPLIPGAATGPEATAVDEQDTCVATSSATLLECATAVQAGSHSLIEIEGAI